MCVVCGMDNGEELFGTFRRIMKEIKENNTITLGTKPRVK